MGRGTKAASKTGVAEQNEIELAAPQHSGRVLEGAKKSTIILKGENKRTVCFTEPSKLQMKDPAQPSSPLQIIET